MLTGIYQPVKIKILPEEKSVGLFDYLANHFENPYTNQIINLRPINYMNSNSRVNLINIFDKRIFNEYWNCDGNDGNKDHYLDVDLNYHFFIPTHIRFRHYPGRYPKKLEVRCGINSEEMETILEISDNTKHEDTVPVSKEKMCRFFRYQMNGLNSVGGPNIDLYDLDLYGSLYVSKGLMECTKNNIFKNKMLLLLLLIINTF